jgi:hypothetical protein
MSSVQSRGREWVKTQKSHPRQLRQWVDCSDPAYREQRDGNKNSPNGSWGIVQIRPPTQSGRAPSKVSSVLRAILSRTKRLDLNHPPTSVGGIRKFRRHPCRLDLNNPPTPVGGISEFSHNLRSHISADCYPVNATLFHFRNSL